MNLTYNNNSLFQLKWPASVFSYELQSILDQNNKNSSQELESLEFLFDEAFSTDEPRRQLMTKSTSSSFISCSLTASKPSDSKQSYREYCEELVDAADLGKLLGRDERIPLWNERNGCSSDTKTYQTSFVSEYSTLFRRLWEEGYFAERFGFFCVDDQRKPWEELGNTLAAEIDSSLSFPLPENLSEDLLYTFVEFMYDFCKRPRSKYFHEYLQCGWHFEDYSTVTGRALYVSLVNDCFKKSNIDLTMASSGTWVGRVVNDPDGALLRLAESAIEHTPGLTEKREMSEALDMYLNRSSSLDSKRAAVILLGRVLEGRRNELKAFLPDDNESFFAFLNNFNIRHNNADQIEEAGVDMLEWAFHSMLASIRFLRTAPTEELTKKSPRSKVKRPRSKVQNTSAQGAIAKAILS